MGDPGGELGAAVGQDLDGGCLGQPLLGLGVEEDEADALAALDDARRDIHLHLHHLLELGAGPNLKQHTGQVAHLLGVRFGYRAGGLDTQRKLFRGKRQGDTAALGQGHRHRDPVGGGDLCCAHAAVTGVAVDADRAVAVDASVAAAVNRRRIIPEAESILQKLAPAGQRDESGKQQNRNVPRLFPHYSPLHGGRLDKRPLLNHGDEETR